MSAITIDAGCPRRRGARRRTGFSLVEISMVLAIVALLVAGIMLFFSNASDARQSEEAVTEAVAVEQAVYSLYEGQADYSGLDTATVADSGLLPRKWASDGAMSNPYHGRVVVYADQVNYGFDIVFYGLSQKGCSDMALAGAQMGSNLVQMVINTDPGNPSNGGAGSYQVPGQAWMAMVAANCRNGSNIRFSMAG